ncbi:hypothetical protein TWF102_010811 [Orbilia oligospora]|uniref:Uncharacterized protein n=1 Tax=Orbilia oligospora TaxID=2813651 RepID=A0A7C8NI18_ORBOL|nr:hypothetical protein TWF102_010811 [Orbilia oligospora]KAF3110018.1 hypothetical protein TWF103_004844 [Orbilia oligospora]
MHSKVILASVVLALIPSTLAAPYQSATNTQDTKCASTINTSIHVSRSNTVDYEQIPSTKNPVVAAPTPAVVWWGSPIRSRDTEHLEVTRVIGLPPIEVTRGPPPPPTITRITEIFPPEATTVTVIPIPPPPPPPKKLHCVQRWFGTAPLCNGKCPGGWNVVRYQREAAKTCDSSTPDKIIDRCENTSKHGCSSGHNKALCEQCEWK